jgi:DNA-binding transcriptional regulator of glucitol operon
MKPSYCDIRDAKSRVILFIIIIIILLLLIPWLQSANVEKLVSTFADRGCHVVSTADPYGRYLDF